MGSRSPVQGGRVGAATGGRSHDPVHRVFDESPLGKLLQKLAKIERAVSTSHGEFQLFGLFLRNNAPNRWDLVVASDWIGDGVQAIRTLADELNRELDEDEVVLISRIVPLGPKDEFLRSMLQAVQVRHGLEKVAGNFGVVSIREGYVFSCDPSAAST